MVLIRRDDRPASCRESAADKERQEKSCRESLLPNALIFPGYRTVPDSLQSYMQHAALPDSLRQIYHSTASDSLRHSMRQSRMSGRKMYG